jgi:beta-barrel assembly-enhancing protease
MKTRLLAAGLLVAAIPAFAQFGGLDIGKALQLGKKAIEANKEYTQEEEIELGNGLAAGMLGASPLHKDERLQRYVNRVGRWVASHSERADLPWTFGVIEADTINAFAMPGGTVIISHGLLKRLQNESELAGVLGHEIAHVVQKHQLKAIQGSAWSGLIADVGKEYATSRVGRGGGVEGYLKSQFASAGIDLAKNGFFVKPLDRSLEYEADRMGVVLAARAGYDPYGYVAVLQLLAQSTPDDEAGILATHPSPAERISELEKVFPALERYAGQTVDGRFKQTVAR